MVDDIEADKVSLLAFRLIPRRQVVQKKTQGVGLHSRAERREIVFRRLMTHSASAGSSERANQRSRIQDPIEGRRVAHTRIRAVFFFFLFGFLRWLLLSSGTYRWPVVLVSTVRFIWRPLDSVWHRSAIFPTHFTRQLRCRRCGTLGTTGGDIFQISDADEQKKGDTWPKA